MPYRPAIRAAVKFLWAVWFPNYCAHSARETKQYLSRNETGGFSPQSYTTKHLRTGMINHIYLRELEQ